ncbi:hypothetical protein [Mycobacterium sp. 236(2023)]|uniref:hypothetical protein n=1 Tax=Mycobacterium sp. 236(2023) TaxID=3038163 RepID=UPI0024154B5F|nr:hypothetical protein [Mycobacterium sp. 236(2023)]MDG4665429.1 hypothetical protein [Mycobacterium sp. 236(2023)]
MRTAADLGVRGFEAIDLATRGERLALFHGRTRYNKQPGAFVVENLVIAELDADGRVAAEILFGTDDTDAAMAELDARYLAGEAAAHAATWSAIVNANAAFNRREMPKTTPDWVNIDHRRGGTAFAPGEQAAFMRATWDVAPQISNRIVAVHRLCDRGVVFTQLVHATSREGFNGEWRDVVVMTVDGDAIDRCEVYDDGELAAAIARFDELGATSSGSSAPASP